MLVHKFPKNLSFEKRLNKTKDFKNHDYSGVEDILWMTERDLKNLGVNNGSHRARLGSSIAILKDKYEKNSKYSRSSLSPPHTAKTKSNSNISPISHKYVEDTQTAVRSWPSTRPSTTHSTKPSSPRSSTENFVVGTEATAEDLKRALEKELSLDSSDLRSYAWYHGTILRQRAEELVSQDGDFLVRDCISQPGDFVITCKWKQMPLHFIIKKVILQPDTVYERIQYTFEKESFDSISDFVTYYVGSKCPLSESSGVIICRPVNRVMPLSYYASRYGIQCQITYVAKALEKIPSSSECSDDHPATQTPNVEVGTSHLFRPKLVLPAQNGNENTQQSIHNLGPKYNSNQSRNLIRMGSDPALSPNTERRTLEQRPNSGIFSSESIQSAPVMNEDKPPPKPSRVPSRKYPLKPTVRKERKISEHEDLDTFPPNSVPIPRAAFKRQISDTRFSFLDRPSISSSSSTPEAGSVIADFTLPEMNGKSLFDPQQYKTALLSDENLPLEGTSLSWVRKTILCSDPRVLAFHLTKLDLQVAKHIGDVDLGLGVTSGLELVLLPQGEQIQKDLLERTKCMTLFIAVLILTCPTEEERMNVLNRWIEIAVETKTVLGNLYGFTSIMLGLTSPEILGLHSTWLALRHTYTENAFIFETKLRPAYKALHSASALEAPNTCVPYILSLILILQKHMDIMEIIKKQSINKEKITNDITDFELPGSNSSHDYGLQLLADHLDIGRNIMQQNHVFKKNGELALKNIKFDSIMLDMFTTEFHLRMLWGFRGSVVCTEQRHTIFQKVVHSLFNKCTMTSN
ncbi:hypothetical protein JTE90_010136 [Oedothorax gibbosus]|uniref:Breast cancer anti-estrogen resistance protein 3 n=1 Tax=Oedothorax gibbosus TaxID=931172 RepID=A0AAV6UK40_9ARAC|nr:hypothetical protein JTE90_010136 [Oedothorax gibbosus]